MLTASDSSGTITREYDALNRVTKYTDVYGKIIQYEYDNVGNLAKLIYPDNTYIRYTYDANNNLSTVVDWAARLTTYTYDANNKLTLVKNANGTTKSLFYDNAQRPTIVEDKAKDGTVIASYMYTYDELGRIKSEESDVDQKHYTIIYDKLSRVTNRSERDLETFEMKNEKFTYDAAGNIVTYVVDSENNTMTYDQNNRLITYNGQTLTYDADGNMISGFLNNLNYDVNNRLTSAGNNVYTYDVENNRVRNVNGTSDVKYTYDTNGRMSQLLMSTDQTGKVTKYVYGLGLIGEDNLTTFKTYHFDLRGSTVAITNTKGAVIDTFKYDTYGKVIKRTGTTNTQFQYNGRDGVMTDENGLLYMRSRYYSPELKRFLNADIVKGDVSHSATLNQYAYVNGNPISYVDPFGTSADQGSGTQNYEKVIDYLQTALDIIGFIPGYGDIADLINALIYAVRGDWANAGLSALAIIPMLGSLGTGTKLGGKAFGKVDDVWAFFRKFGKADDVADALNRSKKINYYVTPRGDAIPATKQELRENLAKMADNNGKYVGQGSNGPVRVRVEDAHSPTQGFSGNGNPDHLVDHIHVEYRQNGQTGAWGVGNGNKTTLPQSMFR